MKRSFLAASTLITFAFAQTSFANSGLFFNVSSAINQLTLTTTIPNHFYPAAGIKITSPGYSLQNPGTECTFAPNGYCLFPVSNTSAAHITISGSVGTVNFILCLNGTGPLSCQNYSAVISAPPPPPPPPPAIRHAYVGGNGTNNLTFCLVNQTTGSLENCAFTGSNFFSPFGIVFNALDTRAYVSNFSGDSVTICNVNQTTGILSGCIDSGLSFPSASGIALNAANTLLYVASNGDGVIRKCDVAVNGTISNCVVQAPAVSTAITLVLNQTGTLLYVGRGFATAQVCTLDVSGNVTSCSNTGGFASSFGIALRASGTQAYVTNGFLDTVSLCDVAPVTGLLSNCTSTGSGFDDPSSIVLNEAETFAYIANVNNSTVSQCQITNTGALTNCTSTGSGFTNPFGIALN